VTVPPVLTRGAPLAPALVLAALAALAGCSAGPPAPYQASVSACYAFAVQALDRHVTVTSVPRACAGLTHEQINLVVERAVRDVVGPRPKAEGRRLAHKEAAYLAYLVTVVPPPRAPAPTVAAPAGRPAGWPLDLGALGAWVVTVAAGAWLAAGWLAGGGLRPGYRRAAGVPRPVIAAHLGLAVAGLGIWIGFVTTGAAALAWVAVGVILSVAGLGMATLVGGLPERAADVARPVAVGAGSHSPAAEPGTEAPAARPVIMIVVHGTLAATTILLVVLAAAGAS
jgi:manganese efflux pump family protein